MLGTEEIRFISFVYDKSCGLNHVPANMSGLRCDERSQRWIKALRHLGCVCAATGNYLPCRSSSPVLLGHFLQFITIGCKVDPIEFQTHPIGSWCHGRSPFERRQHALSAWHRINLTSGKKKKDPFLDDLFLFGAALPRSARHSALRQHKYSIRTIPFKMRKTGNAKKFIFRYSFLAFST